VIGYPPPSVTHDMAEALESVKKIDGLDFTILLSGHGVPIMSRAGDKVAEFCTIPVDPASLW